MIVSDLFQIVKPDLVAPVVAYLCHEECEETGQVFEVIHLVVCYSCFVTTY